MTFKIKIIPPFKPEKWDYQILNIYNVVIVKPKPVRDFLPILSLFSTYDDTRFWTN
jgi:hypothetical protein